MKRIAFALVLALGVLLTGCGSFSGADYIWTETYRMPDYPEPGQDTVISNYLQVEKILTDMVENGQTEKTVSVVNYQAKQLEEDVKRAVEQLQRYNPIAAYALDEIGCEMGSIAGRLVMLINISYRHDRMDVGSIKRVADTREAMRTIEEALNECQSSIVVCIQEYMLTDFAQYVEEYALLHPDKVMEIPQIVENVYPKSGRTRVVELKLHYQSSRETLRSMQDKVEPVFASAELYVSGDGMDSVKFSQLYTFLLERYDYTIKTSITPAYSLLRHGVGDNKAFAMVYAAMCRRAGLECVMVSGTRDGVSHYWNIVCCDGMYYHLDLRRCAEEGRFALRSDCDMDGYVWDYSGYPDCASLE
jgi:hypothetical protein